MDGIQWQRIKHSVRSTDGTFIRTLEEERQFHIYSNWFLHWKESAVPSMMEAVSCNQIPSRVGESPWENSTQIFLLTQLITQNSSWGHRHGLWDGSRCRRNWSSGNLSHLLVQLTCDSEPSLIRITSTRWWSAAGMPGFMTSLHNFLTHGRVFSFH